MNPPAVAHTLPWNSEELLRILWEAERNALENHLLSPQGVSTTLLCRKYVEFPFVVNTLFNSGHSEAYSVLLKVMNELATNTF